MTDGGTRVSTFLLTWNPDGQGWPDDAYAAQVEAASAGRGYQGRWSIALRKSGVEVGDRAFLMRQRHERGLVASGIFASEIYEGQHWDDPTRRTTYADVDWDVLLPVDDRLTVQDLKASLPGVSWDRLQGSGVLVDVASAQVLEDLWAAHAAATPYRAPEDLPPATYTEGAVTRVEVNRYERDRAARAACIAHHGTICAACGFDFEVIYGKLGRDFIHVHHLREISTLGPDYKVDPVTELRPLCANCHSMVHRARPALTIQQLKARIRKAATPTRQPSRGAAKARSA
jgi:5-methylcytosine-specific restriction protein A